MRTPVVFLLAFSSLVTACATTQPHTTLPEAPTKEAPFEERAKYFKAYSADSLEHDHLFLHDGTRVYWPEDLRPAIDADSPTARAIDEHMEARESVETWTPVRWGLHGVTLVGGLLALGGLVGFGAPVALLVVGQAQYTTPLLIGASAVVGIGSLGLVAGLLGFLVLDTLLLGADFQKLGETGNRASRTYNQSLSDRLGVGTDANGIIIDLQRGGQPAPAEPETPTTGVPQDV